jgi:hypothetical protein
LYEIELPGPLHWRVLRQENSGQALSDGTTVRVGVAKDAWAVVGS